MVSKDATGSILTPKTPSHLVNTDLLTYSRRRAAMIHLILSRVEGHHHIQTKCSIHKHTEMVPRGIMLASVKLSAPQLLIIAVSATSLAACGTSSSSPAPVSSTTATTSTSSQVSSSHAESQVLPVNSPVCSLVPSSRVSQVVGITLNHTTTVNSSSTGDVCTDENTNGSLTNGLGTTVTITIVAKNQSFAALKKDLSTGGAALGLSEFHVGTSPALLVNSLSEAVGVVGTYRYTIAEVNTVAPKAISTQLEQLTDALVPALAQVGSRG